MNRKATLLLLLLTLALAPTVGIAAENVIVMVPDGCDSSAAALARWMRGNEPLALDGILTGMVKTSMIDSVISDSAAAATAFATGRKTSDGFVGVGPSPRGVLSSEEIPPERLQYRPLATLLEAARYSKRAVGVVATSRVTHATPAAFAAHVVSRDDENVIMEQMVHQNIDVVFGGGKRHLLPESQGGKRKDGEDLREVLEERGYAFVTDRDGMRRVSSGKVWGMFADSHMDAHIDRDPDRQPSLAEMTAKAIELLSKNPKGFFLVVEGSQPDWGGHANDPIHMVTEFQAFDDAVKVALDFARKNGKTLLMAFPDHNTGGMSIGNERTSGSYTDTSFEDLVDPLQGMSMTSRKLAGIIEKAWGSSGKELSAAEKAELMMPLVAEHWGHTLSMDQALEILALNEESGYLNSAVSTVICRDFTVIGWTSHGHSGEDVPLWAYGPGSPSGLLDNTELAEAASRALGAHLEMTSLSLFSRASESFEYEVVSDGRDEILRITGMMIKGPSKNAKPQFLQIDGVELPVNKNFFRLDGEKQEIYGVVVKTVNGEGEAEYYVPKRLNICIQMGSCPDQFSFGPVEMKAD